MKEKDVIRAMFELLCSEHANALTESVLSTVLAHHFESEFTLRHCLRQSRKTTF